MVSAVVLLGMSAALAVGSFTMFRGAVATKTATESRALVELRAEKGTAPAPGSSGSSSADLGASAGAVGAGPSDLVERRQQPGLVITMPPPFTATVVDNGPGAAQVAAMMSPLTPERESALEHLGPAVDVKTQIADELPYRYPSSTRISTRTHPLDLDTLQKGQSYLWAIGPKGEFLYAPEDQQELGAEGRVVNFGTTTVKPAGRRVKHGDLFPTLDGQRRAPARIGGELHAEKDAEGHFTGRWLLNNQSSYSGPKARVDGKAQNLPALESTRRYLAGQGVDVDGLVLDPFIPRPKPAG